MIYYYHIIVKLCVVRQMKKGNQIYWLRLAISLIMLIGLSFGLVWSLQELGTFFHLPLDEFASLAYLSVFATTLVCNLPILQTFK